MYRLLVSRPKGKYRLPLFIRWLSLEFFSSHCRPQATSGSYRLNVVCIIRVFFKLHIYFYPHKQFTFTHVCVCARANKVHCLTVYNRLSEMGIKRGLHAFKSLQRITHVVVGEIQTNFIRRIVWMYVLTLNISSLNLFSLLQYSNNVNSFLETTIWV